MQRSNYYQRKTIIMILPVWLRLSHWFLFCALFIRSHLRWEKLLCLVVPFRYVVPMPLINTDSDEKWMKIRSETGASRFTPCTMHIQVWCELTIGHFGMFSVIWSVMIPDFGIKVNGKDKHSSDSECLVKLLWAN